MDKNTTNKFTKIVKGVTISQIYYDYDKRLDNCIFVAGVGRSGTTWLSELINYDNSYRFLFEPFWSRRVRKCSIFKDHMYIRPEDVKTKQLNVAKDILKGKVRNFWVDHLNKKRLAKRRIVKDIRSNLFLKWLSLNINIPIIFLIRHPCAVALSKVRVGWEPNLSRFINQEKLVKDYLTEFDFILEKYNEYDDFEKFIIEWCIENYVPLKQFNNNQMLLVFYEDLCVNPESALEEIFRYIGKEWEYNKQLRRKIINPSALSKKGSAITLGADPVTHWAEKIERKRLLEANKIIKSFNLDKIYTADDPMPNSSFLYSKF